MGTKKIILIILGISAILSLINGVIKFNKKNVISKHTVITENPGIVLEELLFEQKIIKSKTKYKDWGKNPFTLDKKKIEAVQVKADVIIDEKIIKQEHTSIILNGILWESDDPRAIINNEIMRINDTIGENILVGIKRDRVILNNGEDNFEIILNEELMNVKNF